MASKRVHTSFTFSHLKELARLSETLDNTNNKHPRLSPDLNATASSFSTYEKNHNFYPLVHQCGELY